LLLVGGRKKEQGVRKKGGDIVRKAGRVGHSLGKGGRGKGYSEDVGRSEERPSRNAFVRPERKGRKGGRVSLERS